jgi:hypothetical protein
MRLSIPLLLDARGEVQGGFAIRNLHRLKQECVLGTNAIN